MHTHKHKKSTSHASNMNYMSLESLAAKIDLLD